MAYNRSYDPDSLPRFAEPNEKPGQAPPPPQQQQQHRPQPPPQQQNYYQQPPPQQRYNQNPQPPPKEQYARPQDQHTRQQDQYARPSPTQNLRQPSNYGHSPPANVASHRPPPPSADTRPSLTSVPPPSPAPGADSGSDPTLRPLFRAVDKAGTGQLTEKELSVALVNGDWTAFDIQTVRMMIRMFDADRSGSIGFDEFCGLWSFLGSWRTLFDRFDVDRSGNISLSEFTDALIAFRYRLSPQFVELLFRTYDKRNEGVMSFDLFVQACISLKRMTDVFKKYDDDRDGYITLSFEDFLSEILKQMK
ncbi:peflin-like protein [Beauveria bassiana ARSEF 2860]|uniref:Peflin-like protein n=1 Tax=Beauveria bassiana (strain ARSEF 2860) TaxID=655819 RepID=J4WL62_BEAB2|nr:peflin-like protein [Beauveria bassiana ARSEF 2860]EJP70485.1 peflin-like protein [Beauveria bassiana ARSEF 2860]